MLVIPFRRSTAASLSDAIRKYIDGQYGQHPDMFRQDLEAIDRIRHAAINVQEPHPSGVVKLTQYAAQLVWLGAKFPIDIGTTFMWWQALGYNTKRPVGRDNLRYELLNVLFNLAALYSQLAEGCPRTTTDGLKAAASHLSYAAGVLEHMRTEVLPNLRESNPPDDIDDHTLESLALLCLAQCQECFWQKAVRDGYKDALVSRLAARLSDLYAEAMDAAARSQAISTAWIHFMSAKHLHFAAAAQYRMARGCLEQTKYGEEIARLQDAVRSTSDGLREIKAAPGYQSVVDDLTNLKKRAEQDLVRAEKDNNMIYLQPVPAKSELALLERANLAVSKVPSEVSSPMDYMAEGSAMGPLLFARLVPFAVQTAVAIYEERRDRLINTNIVQALEDLNTKMRDFLRNLNLPGSLQALEKPLGLPMSVIQHADEIRQADAVALLERTFREIDNLRADNMRRLDQGKALLELEAEEDGRLRAKYGTDRWTRPAGPDDHAGQPLYNKAGEIDQYLTQSGASDDISRNAFAENMDLLLLLVGPDRGLLDFIPASRTVVLPDTLKTAMGQLRRAYNDVQRLESRRRRRIEFVEDIRRRDDVKPDILKEAARMERARPTVEIRPSDFEAFFDQRLDKTYDEMLEAVSKDAADLDKLLAEVGRTNREFEEQRRRWDYPSGAGGAGGLGGAEREQAIQQLDEAYNTYRQVRHNLDLARRFYNDLLKVTGNGFVGPVRAWVHERTVGAKELEEEINLPVLSNLSLAGHDDAHTQQQTDHSTYRVPSPQPANPTTTQQQQQHHHHHHHHHHQQQQQQHYSPTEPAQRIQSWAGSMPGPYTSTVSPPPPVNTATMWTPDMGLRFAAPTAARPSQTSNGQDGGGNGARP